MFGILYNGGKFQICFDLTRLYGLHTPNRRRKSYSRALYLAAWRFAYYMKKLTIKKRSKKPLRHRYHGVTARLTYIVAMQLCVTEHINISNIMFLWTNHWCITARRKFIHVCCAVLCINLVCSRIGPGKE